jgi:hypothetical protein
MWVKRQLLYHGAVKATRQRLGGGVISIQQQCRSTAEPPLMDETNKSMRLW